MKETKGRNSAMIEREEKEGGACPMWKEEGREGEYWWRTAREDNGRESEEREMREKGKRGKTDSAREEGTR